VGTKAKQKVTTIEKAVALINDGDNLSISGFAHSLAPLAIVREIIRQGKKNLELSSMGECWAADFFSAAGCLRRTRLSNYMFEGFGRCMNFSRAVQEGRIQVEDYSHFGITSRLYASALGLSFLPVKVMAGTDILNVIGFDDDKYKIGKCPFTDEQYVFVKAITPNVAIIHASRADERGNVQIFGSTSVIDEQARASRKVIVSVEEIVSRDEIARRPESTILPGFMVDAVVQIPYGAHPAGMYRYYNYDSEHIQHYWESSRSEDTAQAYLEEYVFGVENHMEYLKKIGIERLMTLRADPYLGY
jgi:glutaconate CoA-transferase subunit A